MGNNKVDNLKKVILGLLLIILLISCSTTQEVKVVDNRVSTLLNGKCLDKEGDVVKISSPYYLLYFAADWCPYCVKAEEELVKQFKILKEQFEVQIIFMGHEKDEANEDMLRYLNSTSFDIPYLPYEYREGTGFFDLIKDDKFYIPGFLLLSEDNTLLASSSGKVKEDYSVMRPINIFLSIQQCDCVLEQLKNNK